MTDDTPSAPEPSSPSAASPVDHGGVQPPLLLRPSARRLPLYLLIGCFMLEWVLFMLDWACNFSQRGHWDGALRHIFKTTLEDSLASWASQTQTMLVALTLFLIVVVVRKRGASMLVTIGWLVLAMFFLYMTIDDGAKIHERVGSAVGRMQEKQGFDYEDHFPSYAWQFFVLPVFILMGLFMLGFLWFQLRDMLGRVLVFVAMGMFSLAVGIDFIEGLDKDHRWNIFRMLAESVDIEIYCRSNFKESGYATIRHFSKVAEECLLEIGANSVLWFVFLRHLIQLTGRLHIEFRGREST